MAYNTTTLTRPGSDDLAADPTALLLKVFSGEVLASYSATTIMRALHTMRTITSGRSAQFIVQGVAKSRFHTPGESLLDSANTGNALGNESNDASPVDAYADKIANTEKEIFIDKQLVSSTFVDQLDEKLAHWDVRSGLSREVGRELGKQFDVNCLNTVVAACRSASNLTTPAKPGVTIHGGATVETDADALLDAIASAAQQLDENDVEEDSRALILKPAQYWLLLNDAPTGGRAGMVNRDVTSGNGDVATGKVLKAYGFDIFKSNNMPAQADLDGAEVGGRKNPHVNTSTNTGNDPYGTASNQGGYLGNNADLVAVAFHKSAIGTVKMMDLSVKSEYLLTHMGHLLVCSYSMGHGVLRPECAVEIAKSTS